VREIRFVEAIREAQAEALAEDERVFIIGEEVGKYGGVFRATQGLQERFGRDRVRDTTIAENSLVGIAAGAAIAGMRPIVEIMFMDFIAGAMDAIVNHAAKLATMTGGQIAVPIVVRTQGGTGTHHGAQHSQMLESWFVHVPGVLVAMPSTPADAKGLFAQAMREQMPVIFVECRMLYGTRGEVEEGSTQPIPFGKAVVRREGNDVSVVTAGHMVLQALKAAETVAERGVDVEVVDLRTLVPMDVDTILASVEKTGRLVVAHEATRRGGWGGEVISQVVTKGFDALRAPPVHVGAGASPIPFAVELEAEVSVNERTLEEAIVKCMTAGA